MWTFDDFDAWGECIRGANLRLVCDAVDTGIWNLGRVDLGGVVFQVGSEGGGEHLLWRECAHGCDAVRAPHADHRPRRQR